MSGDFAWKDPTVAPAVSDSQKTEYDVVFTPKDENYDKAECKVKLTVNKTAATITKAPEAKALTYTGSAKELVTAGTATGGEMQYALGTATEATQPYTTSIPSKTDAGTYYVWYRVLGDENHLDTSAEKLKVKISATPKPTAKPTATPKPTAKPTATPKPTPKLTATPKPEKVKISKCTFTVKDHEGHILYGADRRQESDCVEVEKPEAH